MFVVVVYDVDKQRDRKILKICRRYLNHVQKSVLEGNLSDAKYCQMKKEIRGVINVKEDSCLIYCIGNTKFCRKEKIGFSIESELVEPGASECAVNR